MIPHAERVIRKKTDFGGRFAVVVVVTTVVVAVERAGERMGFGRGREREREFDEEGRTDGRGQRPRKGESAAAAVEAGRPFPPNRRSQLSSPRREMGWQGGGGGEQGRAMPKCPK